MKKARFGFLLLGALCLIGGGHLIEDPSVYIGVLLFIWGDRLFDKGTK